MKSPTRPTCIVTMLTLLALGSSRVNAAPMGTAFTYQGRLSEGTNSAQGIYDLRFAIYDAAESGAQVGLTLTNAATGVTNGLFAVALDFGSVFAGTARWLEIGVRTNGGAAFSTLAGRQPVTPTPYAIHAASAATATAMPWSGLTGIPAGFADSVDNDTTYSAGTGLTLAGAIFNVIFSGSGSASSAARSDHGHDANYWKLTGNSGTTAGTHFLGTTDNQSLELKVNSVRALRLEPNATSPSVIAGSSVNSAAVVAGGAIGGGGSVGLPNTVGANFGTIAGGGGNSILNSAAYATIGGGSNNVIQASADGSTIGGGLKNTITGDCGVVPGGEQNVAAANSYAAGRRAKATHAGTFVWADTSMNADFASTGNNEFLIRAAGGVGINTNNPSAALHVAGNAIVSGMFHLGSSTYTPTANATVPVTSSYMRLTPSSPVTLNTTTAIANGTGVGAVLILENATANQVTVMNNANTRLVGSYRSLGLNYTLTLIWNGQDWVELAFAQPWL